MTAIRHGYTLADLHNLAKSAAANNHNMGADHSDLYHAAWSAIVDALIEAEDPPSRHDLARIGKGAIWQLARDQRQTYGYRDRDPYAGLGSAPRFAAYWTPGTAPSPEDSIVDRVAITQIWSALTDRDRVVITAAAACDGDYAAAAATQSMPASSYRSYLSNARRAVVSLWLEGETPHRVRGSLNRRNDRIVDGPCGTLAAARRHVRDRERCPECAPLLAAHDSARKARWS
jgi:DNA-directed RNA polymerase specialized sigma24 family protein